MHAVPPELLATVFKIRYAECKCVMLLYFSQCL